MSQASYERTGDNPARALREVLYEIDMLIVTGWFGGGSSHIGAALLESRLLHTRNLIDFFDGNRRKGRLGDVLASDFHVARGKVALSKAYRDRLNKALAHLAYARVGRRLHADADWPRDVTLLPVLRRCIEFMEQLQRAPALPIRPEDRDGLSVLLDNARRLTDHILQLPDAPARSA